MTADNYLSQLQALLPPGAAWTREQNAVLTMLLAGLAEELTRVDQRAEDLLDQIDPRTADELLPDWETVLGLPDSCTGDLDSVVNRLNAAYGTLTATGGASRAYFIAVAESLGFTVTISEYQPFAVGISAAGDPLYGTDWLYAWLVNAPETTITEFAVGISSAGDPLRSWGNELLECAITKLKPAHTHVLFGYGG